MNFSNSGNNNREAVNVNTRGIQLSNRDGFVPSTMLIGFWNEMISIKLHPALDKSQQTDSKVFDYDKVISTAITLEKATLLIDKIEKDILPAIEEKREFFRGVPVGGDSLIGVGTKVQGDEVLAYFAVFKKLDEQTMKPEQSIYYEFKRGYSVDDYNPESGEFTTTKGLQAELHLFLSTLKASRDALTNAVAHTGRHVDKFFRDRQMNKLEEIGGKLGIESKSKSNYGGGSFKTKDLFGSSSSPKTTGDTDGEFDAPAEVSKLGNIDELSSFMN